MKTLDEVIKALEICDETVTANCPNCPYDFDCENVPREDLRADALHYLWEYRTEQQILRDRKEHYEYWEHKYYAELEKNDPLTWDELKTMEGKPVWVDPLSTKALHTPGWGLVGKTSFTTWEGVECCSIVKVGVTYALPVGEYGKTWKAYRKERG